MNNIIAIASGKGGVGKSTISAALAKELYENGKKVLCIDCDIALRSLDIMLCCSERVVYDWADLLANRCKKDDAIIKTGVDFIAAPSKPGETYCEESFGKMIKDLSDDYDFVFLDCPAGIDIGFKLALSCADKSIVISTPDPVCVRSCNRALTELIKSGITDNRLIINMFVKKDVQSGKALNIDECIDKVGTRLLGLIPFDSAVTSACCTGECPGEFNAFSRAVTRISARLCGKNAEIRFE